MAELLERCFEAVPPGEPAAVLRASAASYAHAWQEHFGREHEPVRLLGERNVFRYRRCRRVLVRAEAATPAGRLALAQVLLAARACDVPVEVSLAEGVPGPWLADSARRRGGGGAAGSRWPRGSARADVERLRALVPLSREVRAAAHAAGVADPRRAGARAPAASSCAPTCASRRSRAPSTAMAMSCRRRRPHAHRRPDSHAGAVMESARRPPVEDCWTMARRADQAGYDAVWVGDSIVAKPRLDALTTLAYLAGITDAGPSRDRGTAARAAPPGGAGPAARQRRPDLARPAAAGAGRGLEPAERRARVGGVRRRPQGGGCAGWRSTSRSGGGSGPASR